MTRDYTGTAGKSAGTIGEVLNGTGSLVEILRHMAATVGQVNDQLESERDLHEEGSSAFASSLESFVVSVSAAREGVEDFVTRLTSLLNLFADPRASLPDQPRSPGQDGLAYAGLKQPQALEESQQYPSQLTKVGEQGRSGFPDAQEILWELLSSVMGSISQTLDQRFTETARFMDTAVASMGREERRDSFSGSLGLPEATSGGMQELALVRVDELNEAVTRFISVLGRIEQTMEKATDIKVTVSAGDGWD